MGGDVLNLLKLPPKAQDALLQHLNLFHLMNLRMVCKTTKSWIDSSPSPHLARFYIHVKHRKFLKTLLKSPIKWSNITLSCDTHDPTNSTWIRDDDYFHIFAKLNTALRILRFTEQRITYTNGLDVILRNCTNLETLDLGTLDLQNVSLPVTSEIQYNIRNHLRKLGISYVAWNGEKDLRWFEEFLGPAINLEYFRVPFILSSCVYNLYPSLDVDEIEQKLFEFTDKYLFKPLKDLLLLEDSRLRRLQVENFDLEQLLQNKLIETCHRSKCLLVHVVEGFERPLTPEESSLLGETIGGILCISKNLEFRTLKNLESISIQDEFVETSDVEKKFVGSEENALKALSQVSLTLTTSILQSERLAFCLLQQRRSSVKSVSVLFQQDLKGSAQASIFRAPKFTESFPNLRVLKLNGFDGKDQDYLGFWKGFPGLEELSLENCRSLGDTGLMGDDMENPKFLELKHLKRLSLEYCDNLTDSSLSTIIAKLPLEFLSLALSKVTYQNGLIKLASREDKCVLWKSLFVFQCIKPDDCGSQEAEDDKTFKTFLSTKYFENLKKYEILF